MYYISRFKDNFTLDYINIIINETNESFNILILPNYVYMSDAFVCNL